MLVVKNVIYLPVLASLQNPWCTLLSGLDKARVNGACNLSVVPIVLGHYSMYSPVLDDGAFTSVGEKGQKACNWSISEETKKQNIIFSISNACSVLINITIKNTD